VEPDCEAIASPLELASQGTLEVRVTGRVPLREAAKAYDKVGSDGGQAAAGSSSLTTMRV
jgi:hypothetical protein